MARIEIELTGQYQQIAAGKCTITVEEGNKQIYFNDVASDIAAMSDLYPKNAQIAQTSDKATFAKSRDLAVVIVEEG